jgi:hypothetical protein
LSIGNHHAEKSQFAEFRHSGFRDPARIFPFRRVRFEFLLREIACRIADHALLVGVEVQSHGF